MASWACAFEVFVFEAASFCVLAAFCFEYLTHTYYKSVDQSQNRRSIRDFVNIKSFKGDHDSDHDKRSVPAVMRDQSNRRS